MSWAGRGGAKGIPADASVVYRFKSDAKFGAILMTDQPVWKQAVYHDQPFREWVKTNSPRLLQRYPDIKEHGLWVVKKTYSTKHCSLNAWTSAERERDHSWLQG